MFKDILDKIKEKKEQDPPEELPDDVTRDKYLRSLRRELRVLNEEQEKVDLKKQIAKMKKERLKKHMFGLKEQLEQKKQQAQVGNILTISKKKKSGSGFFGRYKL